MKTLLVVVKQTSWQVLGKISSSLASLLILGLVTRNYGQSGVGVFTLALAYLSFFYFAADLGLNAHFLPSLTGARIHLVWRRLFGLRLFFSAILMVLAILLLPFLPFNSPTFTLSIFIGSGAIILSAINLTCQALFQKKLLYRDVAFITIIGAITSLLVTWLVVCFKLSPDKLLLGHLLGWFLNAAIGMFLVYRVIGLITPKLDLKQGLKVIKQVWPLSLTLGLSLIYFRLDAFILSWSKGYAEVGIYNIAYSLFQSALLISTFIINSYYPIMLQQLKLGREVFLASIKQASWVMAGLAALGLVVTWWLAPFMVGLLTGSQGYEGSVTSLRILALGFPAFFVSSILLWALITQKLYKPVLRVYITGLLFNLVANLAFIPHFSYLAAASITVISEYLILMLQIITLAILT